jgi:hypothetical protein
MSFQSELSGKFQFTIEIGEVNDAPRYHESG